MDFSNSAADSDRLSELPDSLILEILSLLPMNDVVSTMLLSKRWLHLWTTVPCLDFKYIDTYKNKKFVSGALAHWKRSKIHKFSLRFDLESVDMVDSWLAFAIEKQVEELLLLYYDTDCLTQYCPPQRLYSCSSMTKMSLSFCDLRIDEAVHWNRLKSLEIQGVGSLSEDAMNRILAGAPLLEELILVSHRSIENLNIRSISLKILKLGLCDDIVYDKIVSVWAPNLLGLEIRGVGSLSEDAMNRILAGAPLLEELILVYLRSIENLNIRSISLKILKLGLCDDIVYDKIVSVWAPNLLDLKISGYFYGTCFLDVPSLTNAKIYFGSLDPHVELFRSIRHVEKLTLSRFSVKTLLRRKTGFKFPNAKSLSLYADRADEMLGVVDMFPNLTTLCVQQSSYSLYESHLSKTDLPSPFLPFLKRVEVTWFMRDISIIRALEILLENAKLLDTMVFRADWRYWERGDKPELLLSKSALSPTAEVTIIHY